MDQFHIGEHDQMLGEILNVQYQPTKLDQTKLCFVVFSAWCLSNDCYYLTPLCQSL